MYLQTSHSSQRLELYSYNLQKFGVFQKAHSDKNIQAEACRCIITQTNESFKVQNIVCNKKRIFPKTEQKVS